MQAYRTYTLTVSRQELDELREDLEKLESVQINPATKTLLEKVRELQEDDSRNKS